MLEFQFNSSLMLNVISGAKRADVAATPIVSRHLTAKLLFGNRWELDIFLTKLNSYKVAAFVKYKSGAGMKKH